MSGNAAQAPHQAQPAATPEEPAEAECPICYQEYNQFNKPPRTLECAHVFCAECLQRIQPRPSQPPNHHSPPAIPCPLCRHLTPLDAGDALSVPCDPPVTYRLPRAVAARLATVTQRVVLTVEGENRDARFIILPTVSLQVQQMQPDPLYGMAADLSVGGEVVQQSKKTLLCVQLLAVSFWVLFVITCVVGVVFGPHFLNRKL